MLIETESWCLFVPAHRRLALCFCHEFGVTQSISQFKHFIPYWLMGGGISGTWVGIEVSGINCCWFDFSIWHGSSNIGPFWSAATCRIYSLFWICQTNSRLSHLLTQVLCVCLQEYHGMWRTINSMGCISNTVIYLQLTARSNLTVGQVHVKSPSKKVNVIKWNCNA